MTKNYLTITIRDNRKLGELSKKNTKFSAFCQVFFLFFLVRLKFVLYRYRDNNYHSSIQISASLCKKKPISILRLTEAKKIPEKIERCNIFSKIEE